MKEAISDESGAFLVIFEYLAFSARQVAACGAFHITELYLNVSVKSSDIPGQKYLPFFASVCQHGKALGEFVFAADYSTCVKGHPAYHNCPCVAGYRHGQAVCVLLCFQVKSTECTELYYVVLALLSDIDILLLLCSTEDSGTTMVNHNTCGGLQYKKRNKGQPDELLGPNPDCF